MLPTVRYAHCKSTRNATLLLLYYKLQRYAGEIGRLTPSQKECKYKGSHVTYLWLKSTSTSRTSEARGECASKLSKIIYQADGQVVCIGWRETVGLCKMADGKLITHQMQFINHQSIKGLTRAWLILISCPSTKTNSRRWRSIIWEAELLRTNCIKSNLTTVFYPIEKCGRTF